MTFAWNLRQAMVLMDHPNDPGRLGVEVFADGRDARQPIPPSHDCQRSTCHSICAEGWSLSLGNPKKGAAGRIFRPAAANETQLPGTGRKNRMNVQ